MIARVSTLVHTHGTRDTHWVSHKELVERITEQTRAITLMMPRVTDPVALATYRGMLEAHTFTLKMLGITDV